MADVVISVVTKVAECLVGPTIRRGKYFLCVNKVINDFEKEKNELISERDHLQYRVEQAKERAEVIGEPVKKWLNDVENLLKEVVDLEQSMTTNTSCFQGQCPTWTRYRLCKQMIKKKEAIGNFKGKSNINPFSHRAPLPGIQYQSSENFIYFESTKVAYNQLLEALQDSDIYMIGVYGMGGAGKTSLVTEVGKKVEGLKLFDKVIFITVSHTPNTRDIQDKMAETLIFELKEKTEEIRAQRLWLSLKEKKRILVIVDDLWGEFNLMNIGIRLGNDNKGAWKILVTTRNQRVCTSMDCQKKIHLGLLSKDESWTLFQKHAKIDDKFSMSLDGVPQKLCDECNGLPIAIKTVGSSLKGKHTTEWEVALDKLRDFDAFDDHEEGVRDALCCIKLSYDYLKNKEAEMLFLMCSVFPEDYNISIEDLTRYAIGLGVGGRSSKSTRSLIQASIMKLIDSCLLVDAKDNHYVKMHDMVRDTALWIAKNLKNGKILVNVDKPLSTLAEDDSIRECFAVSSWHKEHPIFHKLHAPKLEILLLRGSLNLPHATFGGIEGLKIFSLNNDNYSPHVKALSLKGSLNLSHATFKGIEGLEVFSLINDNYGSSSLSLPLSIQLLTNLGTLCLTKWDLGDISFIESLTTLEVLDLQFCSFNELPNEIGKLKRLKVLDLSYCRFLKKNYNGAIGKCSQLEELYILGWVQQEYYSQCVADIITLELQRFVIHTFGLHFYARTATRVLHILDFNISNLRESRKNILQFAKIVSLEHLHGGCKNIIPNMVGVVGGMNGLTCLRLDSCQEIECIFDTETDSKVNPLIPKLTELVLVELKNLKELCRGPPMQVLRFFEKLEKLEIWNCLQLHSVFPWECNLQNLTILIVQDCKFVEALFSMSVAQSLQRLEVLEIARCSELKHIIANEKEHGSNTSNEIVQAPTVRSPHFVMPRFKKLRIVECKKLESIIPIWCVEGLATLEVIEIFHVPKLKLVFGQYDHRYHSCHHHQYQNQDMRPCLKLLTLEDLENLVGICPENNPANWPSLMVLSVKNCPKLTTSWIATMVGSDESEVVQIEKLTLRGFSGLSLISRMGPAPGQILSCQCLQHLKVGECENLISLFSMEVHRCLPKLISLKIYECQELEQIIEENEELVQLSNAQVCFPKLTDIGVYNCNKLTSLFTIAMVRMLPQLETLIISGAAQLEVVFRHGGGDDTINESEIVLPKLKRIELHELPSFVDICKGFKLKSMKLKHAHIDEFPKTAPSLREIQVQLLETQGYNYDHGEYSEDSTAVEDREEKDSVI